MERHAGMEHGGMDRVVMEHHARMENGGLNEWMDL
jgi:hypothetical protein